MSIDEHRRAYVRYVCDELKTKREIWSGLGFDSFEDFVKSPNNILCFLRNSVPLFCREHESSLDTITKTISQALIGKTKTPTEITLQRIHDAFSLQLSLRQFLESLGNNDAAIRTFLKKPVSNSANMAKSADSVAVESFPGALLIDGSFKRKVLLSNINTTPEAFYLANRYNFCQWYGIMKDEEWDVERKDYPKIMSVIKTSFQAEYVPSNICAVILAESGNGKSTVARRLAADFMNDLKVLWITEVRLFLQILNFIESDYENKYLLIIDNWDKKKIDEKYALSFLDLTAQFKNARVVITNGLSTKGEYDDNVESNNIFRLTFDENFVILKKVLTKFPKKNEILSFIDLISKSQKLFNNTLYLLLYAFLNNEENNPINTDAPDPFQFQFHKLFKNQLKKLFDFNPGAAQSLYYFAHLNERQIVPFTWEGFNLLTNYYNKELFKNKSLKAIREFDADNNLTCKYLSRYFLCIQVEYLSIGRVHLCFFHHKQLTKGFFQPLEFTYPISIERHLEAEDILRKGRQIALANEINYNIRQIANKSELQKLANSRLIDGYEYLSVIVDMETTIYTFYLEAKKYDDKEWKPRLISVMLYLTFWRSRNIKVVVRNLVILGCKTEFVLELNKRFSTVGFFLFPKKTILLYLSYRMRKYPQERDKYVPESYFKRKP